jgi:predicted esterase
MDDRMSKGPSPHEDGFAEWLRQRDQSEMVMTDKDFMKDRIFNSAEMSTKITHSAPVQHVLGSPKTDAYGQALGGAVQVTAKPRPLKKTLDHDEILVRMLAVPVEENMIYADLNKSGVCLGMSGVGRIEQVGARIEELKQDDPVLVMPKPTKFSSQRPIGTAKTLLICQEEDVFRIPSEILEELTPEQICLTPTIVCAYSLLETFGAKLKPGDSVLLNAAHLSSSGSAILQLCKLLKLKPLCLVNLPGAPRNCVKGEHGSKAAWQDQETRAVPPPAVRAQYERITEWLITMGAEETFPDGVALLRWRDRNQRILPKLALDGIATRESAEQLMHCLRPGGDIESQVVVYGWGNQQPIEVSPVLLAAWGGAFAGFNIARWVHALSANSKKMMLIMENITKLVRANKFNLDTVLYKVGEDAISDAFSRAADASDNAQVVLIFPTLQEELQNSEGGDKPEAGAKKAIQQQQDQSAAKKKEEDEREKLKSEWLNLLFTDQSVAATSPEGPLPVTLEGGNKRNPTSLVVWVGDNPGSENKILKDLSASIGQSAFMCVSWSQHPAGEGLLEFNLSAPEVVDGSWYLRDRNSFENEDLDMLHDVELLGRSTVEAIEPKLEEYKLTWSNVVLLGFGFGAGIAAYASLLRVIPKQVAGMILFNPVVPFPALMAEKMQGQKRGSTPLKLFTIWGPKDKSTPNAYKQSLNQALRKAPEVNCTVDSIPDCDHSFGTKSFAVLTSLVPLCLPR